MTDNTIQGLRKVQWGIEAVKATGTLTMDTQPTPTDDVTVGTITYTWVASGAIAGQINVGADVAAAKVNFVAAINGTDAINDPNPFASAAAFVGDVCTLTARVAGPTGSAVATTENFTAVTNVFNATTLGATVEGVFARGTAVAATSIMAVENLVWGDEDELIYRPQIANGLLIRNRGAGTPTLHGTRFTLTDQPVVFEQLMHWLSMAISGVPVVTGAAGGPFTWTFTRDPTTNPNPASFTIERLFSNGLGDTIDQRAAYGMLGNLTLRYAVREHLRLSGDGFARKFESMGGGVTPGLTMPNPELGVSALSTVYADALWANVGDTLLAEQVVGWEISIGTGFMPLMTAEGRTTLDFTKHLINAGEVTLGARLTLLVDPTQYDIEQAAAAAGDARAFRVRTTGTDGRQLDIDMMLQHTKPALFKIGEQDGQDIIELELEEGTDNTNFLRVTLVHPDVNSLA